MASAIIRSVAVHTRPINTLLLTDCICIDHRVSSSGISSPYLPTQIPPVEPYHLHTLDDEGIDSNDSKISSISLCACVSCGKGKRSFCFERFQNDVVSTSTELDIEKDKFLQSEHLAAIIEYTSVEENIAALGVLSKKQSPLFVRKKQDENSELSATTLAHSFSLRTVDPFYAGHVRVKHISRNNIGVHKDSNTQHKDVDHNAVEAISMTLGVANSWAGSPPNSTIVMRNNGQIRNGVSIYKKKIKCFYLNT
ncbi:unnamed protein product [Ceratitis capitata]|uniref:(Mediterranean fruit fly) hypothetical protein n=1 Tax=Ceratitis capitata TaxID=7213 RepID=A0A811VL00_CERCA|nr:unnamed protein product [Ceratitis capitata]